MKIAEGERGKGVFSFLSPPLPPCLALLHVPLGRALQARAVLVSLLSVSCFQIANCASLFAMERNDSEETGK